MYVTFRIVKSAVCYLDWFNWMPPIPTAYWEPLQELISIPAGTLLMYDFLVLFCVCRQHFAVQIEDRTNKLNQSFPGGSNWPKDAQHRRQHDFTAGSRTWLDVAKRIVLQYLYLLCLVMLFVTGTRSFSMFAPVYVIGSFIFLWQGSDFFLRPNRTIVRCWQCLIGCVLFAIAGRLLLQVPSCVLAPNLDEVCRPVRILGTRCWRHPSAYTTQNKNSCVESLDMGTRRIEYDVISLGLLLLQLRLYHSVYFVHLVNDTKAVAVLSSRAVQLIESLHCKEIAMQTARDDDMVSKIRGKVDAMKTNQLNANPMARVPRTHFEAIHAGCAGMFCGCEKNLMARQDQIYPSVAGCEHVPVETVPEIQTTGFVRLVSLTFRRLLIRSTLRLYMLSRNYRYVARMLNKERRALKFSDTGSPHSDISINHVDQRESADTESHFRPRALCLEFIVALGDAIIAHTALICYLVVFVNMTVSANLLSLPLPLMVLLWGTLSSDGPTKSFWVTMLAYTQVRDFIIMCSHISTMIAAFLIANISIGQTRTAPVANLVSTLDRTDIFHVLKK